MCDLDILLHFTEYFLLNAMSDFCLELLFTILQEFVEKQPQIANDVSHFEYEYTEGLFGFHFR